MDIGSQTLLIFSAIGAINALLIALFLFFKTPRSLSNRLLAGLVFVLSIRILKSVLFFFSPDISKLILQIGLSACFMIGPFVYLYVVSAVGDLTKQLIDWRLHLGMLAFGILAVGFIYPYQDHQLLWGTWIYRIVNYSWLFYLVLTGFSLRNHLRQLFSGDFTLQTSALPVGAFLGISIIWLAFYTASYTSYIAGSVTYSFIVLLTCGLYLNRDAIFDNSEKQKYANKRYSPDEATQKQSQLMDILETTKPYLDSNLTLSKLARQIGWSAPQLSQLLNDNIGKSFTSFIAEYRIAEAKRLLELPRSKKMEVIAEECGFNSLSTFYDTFKKITDQTPANYRNACSVNDDKS